MATRKVGAGTFVIAAALSFVPAFTGDYTLRCRRSGDCTLTSSHPAPFVVDRFPAASIVGASVTESAGKRRPLYQLRLALRDREVVLAGPDATREEKEQGAAAIAAFLAEGGPAEIQVGDPGMGIYTSIAGVWVLAAIMYLAGI